MSGLNWIEEFDDSDNSIWTAASAYHDDGNPIMWRLRQQIVDNHIEWYEAHDGELLNHSAQSWPTLDEAKSEIEQANQNILASA